MPSGACSGIRNFAFKAAKAHFERSADCVEDEVMCRSCGVTFCDWKNESPAAVHRVISPVCPALNPADDDTAMCPGSDAALQQLTDILASLGGNPYARYLPDRLQEQFQIAEREAGCRTPEQPSRPERRGSASRVRRELFRESGPGEERGQQEGHPPSPRSESPPSAAATRPPIPRVLDQTPITHPFGPKCGGYDNLFASRRLQTFPPPTNSPRFQTWAEEGFVFRERQQDVMCVFCGTVLVLNGHQPADVHGKACAACPLVMGFDAGNISQQQEMDIRLRYFTQQAAKRQVGVDLAVKYPHYDSGDVRRGSFAGWPKMCARLFPPDLMASAGFFYSGKSQLILS